MQLKDMILVIENEKGTEKNLLMDFTQYMLQIGTKVQKTALDSALHTLDLERTKEDSSMWTELYYSANRSVGARYCYDLDQLCDFLSGIYNDRNSEHYFVEERCAKECLNLLEELGINRDGTCHFNSEFEQEYAVEIREILSRIKNVKASSLAEAIDKVMDMYNGEEIILGAEDFKQVTIEQEQIRGGR